MSWFDYGVATLIALGGVLLAVAAVLVFRSSVRLHRKVRNVYGSGAPCGIVALTDSNGDNAIMCALRHGHQSPHLVYPSQVVSAGYVTAPF